MGTASEGRKDVRGRLSDVVIQTKEASCGFSYQSVVDGSLQSGTDLINGMRPDVSAQDVLDGVDGILLFSAEIRNCSDYMANS